MASNQEKGGYDVEFVGIEPKNVTCSICLFVLKEPMQAEECGHRFCRSCIDDLKDNSDKITCPQDRIVNKVFRDKGKERDILDYVIKCTNASNGCQWTGELRDLEKHKENCAYQLVSCVNEGCNEEIQRRHLLQHVSEECSLRIVKCEHCKIETIFCDLEEHNRECLEKPVQCSRCKRKDIPKEMMDGHLEKECPLVVCEYSDIGCQETVERDCMFSHKEDSTATHLDCVISRFREQEQHLRTQLQQQKSELDQQSVTIHRQKKQLEEQQHTITGLQFQMREIMGKLNNVQPQTGAFQDELVWIIENFYRKFEGVRRGNNMYKKAFFTQKGYKFCAELYLNGYGDDKGTHVSLYLGLEKGPFDDALAWPLNAKISACVLKDGEEKLKDFFSTTQSNELRQSFRRPQNSDNRWGFNRLVPHNSIKDFIVNDTVTFKVYIE